MKSPHFTIMFVMSMFSVVVLSQSLDQTMLPSLAELKAQTGQEGENIFEVLRKSFVVSGPAAISDFPLSSDLAARSSFQCASVDGSAPNELSLLTPMVRYRYVDPHTGKNSESFLSVDALGGGPYAVALAAATHVSLSNTDLKISLEKAPALSGDLFYTHDRSPVVNSARKNGELIIVKSIAENFGTFYGVCWSEISWHMN